MIYETDGDRHASAVARMDMLAPQLIALAAPLRLGVARTPPELEAVYRLRHRIAVARGWAVPNQFPDGLERDAYDSRAITVAAWDGASLVAAARIVLPVPGERLPTEDAFGLQIEPRGRVVDLGRLVVAPGRGEPRCRILPGLAGRIWIEMRGRGFAVACASLSRGVARLYRSSGLAVTILGPHRLAWGEERHPALIAIESLQITAAGGSDASSSS